MTHLEECQMPGLPRMADGLDRTGPTSLEKQLKRSLAKVWNYTVKKMLKKGYRTLRSWQGRSAGKQTAGELRPSEGAVEHLKSGDVVRVRSQAEIQATLDPWKELKGCAFLEYMWPYCGTTQRVLQPLERFLDERDYKVKTAKGIVLLEGVICRGTPVFGRCDRCCHLFWREEWLEKIDPEAIQTYG